MLTKSEKADLLKLIEAYHQATIAITHCLERIDPDGSGLEEARSKMTRARAGLLSYIKDSL